MEEAKENNTAAIALHGATLEVKCRACNYVLSHWAIEQTQRLIFPTFPVHPCPECQANDWIFAAHWTEGIAEPASQARGENI